jgi:MFS transporter, YNFM family, putative membrane transport protein
MRQHMDGDGGELRVVKTVLATAVLAGAASMRSLDTLLPDVAQYYGRSVGTSGAAVTAYAISYSGCQLLYGPAGDRMGPYRIITLAAILSSLAALGCALAPTFTWLVALRFLAGAVAAAVGPLTIAFISHATDSQERPVAVAHLTGASIIGGAAGQAGGGLIGQILNWQAGFLFIAILFALSGWAMARTGARHPHLRAIGRTAAGESGIPGAQLGALLRRPAVRLTLIAVGVEGLATYASFTYVSAMLHGRFALGTAMIGLLIGLFGVGGIVFVLIVRRLIRRLRESRRAALGGILLGVGFVVLTLGRSLFIVGAAIFALGLGFFMLHNVLQVRATHMAPDTPGAAISLFAASFFSAQALGVTIGGWSFDHLGASTLCYSSAALLAGLGLAMGWISHRQETGDRRMTALSL